MLKNQLEICHSADLKYAKDQIAEISEIGNHITQMLTLSDLIQLGGYAAVQYCGGPEMMFRMGRPDAESEGDAVHHDRETYGTSLCVQGINQAKFTPQEHVAIMGIHTLGFVGMAKKGPDTRWCMNPYVFDNTYYKELMLGDRSKYYRTDADRALMNDSEKRQWVERYAADQDLFFAHYAAAHVKVSELTFENTLASEVEPHYSVDGGYQEPTRPLLQGVYEGLDRLKENLGIAKTENEVAEIEEPEEHDDDEHTAHH